MPPGGAPPTPGAVSAPAAPAIVQQTAPQAPANLPERIEVLTLDGEIVAVDIRNAFTDLKLFVQKLQQIGYFSQVVINSCELDRTTGRLKFLLTIQLKN